MGDTIGEIAIKLLENKLKSKELHGEGLLCVGAKGAGKTTLLNIFLEKDDTNPKETLSLEYTFGRKSLAGQYGEKKVCHIWEVGGAMLLTPDLLTIPSAGGGVTAALVVVDLSIGGALWFPLQEYTSKLKENGSLSLYIVGSKYDLFRKLDLKQRMQVNKMLRVAALLTGAGVFMFSCKEPSLIRRTKEILNQLTFGQGGAGTVIKTFLGDSERPMQIAPGGREDSWGALGFGGPIEWSEAGEWMGEIIRADHSSSSRAPPSDPSLEAPYREPLIDAVRTRKDHQLQLLVASQGQSYF